MSKASKVTYMSTLDFSLSTLQQQKKGNTNMAMAKIENNSIVF